MSTPSKLSQLRELSVVVADTGDYEAIKRLQPVDCTTNPTLVKKALDLPVYAELIERELAWGRQQGGDREAVVHAVADRLTIGVGALLSTLVPGRVSTEVDADLAHDTAATVAKARQFIQMYADAGVPREKILIKIAATWEGVEAARILQAEGIDCNLTLIFNPTQALACSEAGAFLISPFVGRLDWYVANGQIFGHHRRRPGREARARRVRRIQASRFADGGDGRLVPFDRADRSTGRLRPPDDFAGPAGEAGRRPRRAAARWWPAPPMARR